jgi:Mor family transcriptional regulator
MMAEIEKVIYESLKRGGVTDPDRITRLVTNGLRREFCGTSIYIDRNFKQRNEMIKIRFNSGCDIAAIARDYSVTPRRISRIVKGWK